jgi:hypothetical protein
MRGGSRRLTSSARCGTVDAPLPADPLVHAEANMTDSDRPDFQPPANPEPVSPEPMAPEPAAPEPVPARPVQGDRGVALQELAIELGRRIRVAVYGVVVTLSLFGWTLGPWVVNGDRRYDLWEFYGSAPKVGLSCRLLPMSMTLTLILGVVAGAEGGREIARAAAVAATVTEILGLVALVSLSDDLTSGIAWTAAQANLLICMVIWAVTAWSAPYPSMGRTRIWLDPKSWRPGRRPSAGPPGRPDSWMDKSFGTMDKRFRR